VGRRNLGQAIRIESSHAPLRFLMSVKPVRLGTSRCFPVCPQGGPPRIDECTVVQRVSLDCEARKRGCCGLMGTSESDHCGRSSIFASLMTFAQRIGLSAHYRKLMWQGKLPRGWRTAFVYRPHFHLWEDANVLDCDPRVEPKANASRNAERPSIRQGVPVNRAA
jgi:hypothetical protein